MKNGCIVLNYCTAEVTKKNVDILITKNEDVFVTIVDNRSPTEDFESLLGYYNKNEQVDVILSPENGGYSKGNNFGIRYLINKYPEVEYITIMNPDVRCDEEGLLQFLIDKLAKDSDMAMIAPLMLEGSRINTYKIGWNLPTYKELLLSKMYICGKYLKSIENKYIPISDSGILKFDTVQGSFFVIKRNIFEKMGFFDENVFMYSEENILGAKLKVQNSRYYAGVDPKHFYLHEHSFCKKNLHQRQKTIAMQILSERYYVSEYCKIGWIRKIILIFCGWMYLHLEIVVANAIKNMINKIKGDGK